jgi:hypothetical protein
MIEVTKWPVIIIATPRSGSTELAFQLWKEYNLKRYPTEFQNIYSDSSIDHLTETIKCFPEPNKDDSHYDFVNTINSGNSDYIAKFMVDQIGNYSPLDKLLESDCFKIRLLRENLEDQIVSLYIARVRNNWHQFSVDVAEYEVPVDVTLLRECIVNIKFVDTQLRNAQIDFDVTVTYETMKFGESVDCFKITPPTNVNKIRDIVRRFL